MDDEEKSIHQIPDKEDQDEHYDIMKNIMKKIMKKIAMKKII